MLSTEDFLRSGVPGHPIRNENQPKEKVLGRTSLRTSGQKLQSGPLKGLIFRSLSMPLWVASIQGWFLADPTSPSKGVHPTPQKRIIDIVTNRHRVNGVGRGQGQAVLDQILTRFHGIRLKSGRNPLKSCVLEGTGRTLAGSKRQNPVRIRLKSG